MRSDTITPGGRGLRIMSLLSENPSRGEMRRLAADLERVSKDPDWHPPVELIQKTYESLSGIIENGSNRDCLAASHLLLSFKQAFDRQRLTHPKPVEKS